MARIAGITTDKDVKGNIKKITFDFKKHGEKLMPILLELGAIEDDEFEKEWKKGISVEDSRKKMHDLIDEQWKDR